ncbi:NAD(P)H-dependent flavin oxidoreductase [Yinghuangia soli]|uniref:Propionate 3-nitronate monooxygenase n=1 Tax=Yinghuangia soli TaxID=2908204 RepID=A0AA41TXQ6_9ACTN|nr:nitronate monooxygenase [Yinghuangia soli]MCF2527083.1 nitronate monooxygenase [Yinghuangia soli]
MPQRPPVDRRAAAAGAGGFRGFGPPGPVGAHAAGVRAVLTRTRGLGSFGAHHLHPGAIKTLVHDLKAATTQPFAVNLWIPLAGEPRTMPARPALRTAVDRIRPFYEELGLDADALTADIDLPDYDDQIAALLEARPPVVSFVMGIPSHDVLAEARRLGITTLGTATTVAEAVALADAGLDAVVASGSDAGGHRGAFLRPVGESLVGTFALIPQVADAIAIPVIAAGGIADGRGIAAALTLGADGVQIGTGFLGTDESAASPVHRAALHSDAARTTVLTRLFSGRTARGIPNRLTRELAHAEQEVPAYPVQNALMQPLRRAATLQGTPDLTSLWSGQAAPLTRPGPARAYLESLIIQAAELLAPAR